MTADIDDLRLLLSVAERGSIGGAAAEHGVTQPSASRRMRALEHQLGLNLLQRSTAGSSLTDAGRVVAGWAIEVVRSVDDFSAAAASLSRKGHATLRATMSMTVAEYLAPEWLVSLSNQAPDVEVALTVANSAGVLQRIRNGEADLGFVETPTLPRDVSRKRIGTDELVAVVGMTHPLSSRRRLAGAELSKWPLLLREKGSGTRDTADHALAGASLGHLDIHEFPSNAALRAGAAAGAGIALVSALAVADDLTTGRLMRLPVQLPDPGALIRPLHAVWPRGVRLSGVAASLVAVAATLSKQS